ncbi:DUF1120 domain-containing protein [Salmonella enterica]|uniref:Outer membrane protein n=2 Tax=Salmonella enterica TaxID=28901 RepID=A0A379QU06_SALER|nr:DUF1120 domain-containing protein [Salmonella enterica]ECC1479486.1 DUF1120 domain-containing protein [Salmonella enterica subsp. salamae]ASG89709.1 hypothetical protein LFZ47_20270 [Salmonella enterica subsp. salamae serovar 55:k:z39 str. 1315K]ECC1657269.1 DUF1120 domain-containing protein [Salmonella enterica subsp. salamae]ECD9415607.1 DUF1120 domain-containing protein [Salmonella enterica subsp. salamae]ECF5932442.1 DUF1120 domain-containing protein [Salmonella enterica subsp. salamae]
MKKLIIAASVAMALSAAAHADSTAVLKLQGVLTNDACIPTLDGGGVVDFGTKYINTLSKTETNQLGNKDLNLTISCSSPTKVAFSVGDDRADSVANVTIENVGWFAGETAWSMGTRFGAGKTAGNVNIGAYSITMNKDGITADGSSAKALQGAGNTDWSEFGGESKDTIQSNNAYGYTVGNTNDNTPNAFTTAVFPLRIALAVQKTDTLAITDDTPIDGQATITLHYL